MHRVWCWDILDRAGGGVADGVRELRGGQVLGSGWGVGCGGMLQLRGRQLLHGLGCFIEVDVHGVRGGQVLERGWGGGHLDVC